MDHGVPPTTSTTAAAAAPPTTLLGKYELGRLLGRGAFAKVYRALSLTDATTSVAIKIIDKSKMDSSMAPRVITEIHAMGRLHHPNTIRIHEVLATKSKIYLVMDLAPGGDLHTKLSRRPGRFFPERVARRYFHQIVSALHFCHQHGVAHRDVKPQNVLLDAHGNVKISDFGLSAVASASEGFAAAGTLLQTACGTPVYVAPEVVRREPYDGAKADAWSCGVILFVMLVGGLPFDDSNPAMMFRKIYRREIEFPSSMSRAARVMIFQLLDPNPKTRLSIEEITRDTWFRNGKFGPRSMSLGDLISLNEPKFKRFSSMNAFDIIGMNPGLNLSGLFDDGVWRKERRFTSSEPAVVVVEKLAEVGGSLGYEVEKGKDGNMWLGKGKLLLMVVILQAALELLVVEMTVVEGGGGGGCGFGEVQWTALKSGLGDIAASWHN